MKDQKENKVQETATVTENKTLEKLPKPSPEELAAMPWQEREKYKTIADLSEAQRKILRNRAPYRTDEEIDAMTYLQASLEIDKKMAKRREAEAASPSREQILTVCRITGYNYDEVAKYSRAKCSDIIYRNQLKGQSDYDPNLTPEEKAASNS